MVWWFSEDTQRDLSNIATGLILCIGGGLVVGIWLDPSTSFFWKTINLVITTIFVFFGAILVYFTYRKSLKTPEKAGRRWLDREWINTLINAGMLIATILMLLVMIYGVLQIQELNVYLKDITAGKVTAEENIEVLNNKGEVTLNITTRGNQTILQYSESFSIEPM